MSARSYLPQPIAAKQLLLLAGCKWHTFNVPPCSNLASSIAEHLHDLGSKDARLRTLKQSTVSVRSAIMVCVLPARFRKISIWSAHARYRYRVLTHVCRQLQLTLHLQLRAALSVTGRVKGCFGHSCNQL